MKAEYKKVSELLALEDTEVLKEFEMIELQGGKNLLTAGLASDLTCTSTGNGCINLSGCPCTGGICFSH